MNTELEQQLYDKYPCLFTQRNKSPQETAMCFGLDIGPGWYSIMDKTCAELSRFYPTLEFVQVKEKWALLRMYFIIKPENFFQKLWYGAKRCIFKPYLDVFDIIDHAEYLSSRTCEECGGVGYVRRDGYWRTLCGECYAKRERHKSTKINVAGDIYE